MNTKPKNHTRKIAAGLVAVIGLMGTLAGAVVSLGVQTAQAAPTTINPETIWSSKVKDMTATLTVQEIDRPELRKIGGAFATSYSIKHVDVSYQYPNKARFEGRILGAPVVLVYNGDQKMYKTPIKSGVSNVAGQPGQKQTLMDVGLFAKDYLTTDYLATFVRMDGDKPVYKLSQRNSDNNSHEIVTVNPKTSIIERRLSYNGEKKLIKEMRFKNPVQARPGVWVPTRLEIYNAEGKFGVAQSLDNIKVNLGVDSNLFKIS